MTDRTATLILDDGSVFHGISFGYEKAVAGEVVFNTAMTGYPESLTDPSYAGQLMVLTYPLIGNYGVPSQTYEENGLSTFMESDRIYADAIIVSDYSKEYSHWNAVESLSQWLKKEQIPGIYGIDTRALTKLLREKGSMKGKIVLDKPDEIDFCDPNAINQVAIVSTKEVITYGAGEGKKKVVLVDCGVKHNIIRCLLKRGVTVIRVPWDYDFNQLEYDGLFISNGPGDPDTCDAAVQNIRKALSGDKPICGICMGNQLLGKAGGASIYKLKYGHRSHNQPVRMVGTNKCFITSQNHGYAVDDNTLGADWEPLFVNMNDGTNEGIRHKTKPFFSSQFHPEASSGPTDTEFIFDMFVEAMPPQPPKGGANEVALCPPFRGLGGEFRGGKVLVLGSGALKIGEAGEFDYSGSQALKAIKEEGIETVLINPNIATVQTSEGVADTVYFLPVTPFFVEKVIEKERPEGILLAFGGQTALNCGVALYQSGVLEKYNVRVLGTPVQAIMDTEDRELFVRKLDEINVKTIKSEAVNTIEDARRAAAELGYPVIIRAAYALGGLGSGFCDNEEELNALAEKAFSFSPQVLVEKSLKGWKEVEYEVVRDRFDNCITVCNMENFDPLGIHTGESIVIAPSQTLTNSEYHKLRELAIRIIRHIGIVGECNVQYALDPESEDYRVIEVNARLSRSSALASKATGYPLAFVAAKLGLGYGLFDLKNSVTKTTSAFFEPALDYVVCKIPRWDLGKFQGVDRELGSSMKSVGEVMAIGRTFEEAIQKGLRMIGQGMHGFVENKELVLPDIDKALKEPTDSRVFVISKAFRSGGYTIDQIHELTKIDKWFLQKLHNIIRTADELECYGKIADIPDSLFRTAKSQGFSDFQIARAIFKEGMTDAEKASLLVRQERKFRKILPVVKQIDTLAAEYPAQTNYLYLTYNGIESDVHYLGDRRSIIVLGSGAYRIGSSVEFDWCGVQALNTIRKEGWRSVMINYNPETVSTDYDMCDRLYFDELTFERVMDIHELENPHGMIVSTGGQIPNNLAIRLDEQHVNILGTSAQSIDNAEDRHKFSAMLDRIGVDQPRWKELSRMEDINTFVEEVGFPVLVRPSYVLSGAAMNVCSNQEELERFLKLAANVSKKHPVVVSQFIEHAKEVEVDAVAEKGEIVMYAISEHIEFAGVHSGDATIQFPAQKLYVETVRRIKRISKQIAKELNISGPFNIQYLAKGNEIKVIECNLRASRSFPFVSKVLKINFIELATRVMLGLPVQKLTKNAFDLDYVGIKASQFSFSRLQKADPVLGVDMASTGEVGCIADDTSEAVLKSMLSVGYQIPKKNILLSTGTSKQKVDMLDAARLLSKKGYNLYATGGTHRFLKENGIESTHVYWPSEEGQPQALNMLREKKIDMVVNIPRDLSAGELDNGYKIRRASIDLNIPLLTNARLADAFITAFCTLSTSDLQIKSWKEYK
ncbi:carbamoyl-phosphate synthase large subunit [Parabacteroides sp. PF5-5]|uniref:carbamoyl-phosphate synthase (glutamine-hydrolyzing) large subunit n=1 Tax=unclassified Parabacteroides TaxID=2649774 RepID=UPI00247D9536|nr:carbamoyl-phosphate synthase large subunit [Parabacteroides sp. PH5-39]MDH6317782.1 carbamoyl-phosphate synthase large subunit [Parabacteroides sp. PF5-13]MDH6320613.1 carbamoyl-phosphate synthase large subunit [Parabacteroides sp. PH5-13]MDH6324224.1 carbamoyl-phosphate synthase large subunit [Parabacteroides sp. PH5-8]MDH6328967.1 carbamoyl-phosphate synthase large subunit [Parabacteroides sp. PH5-41]MDH6336741.1 carbamoyl-phosphate synthase large subunit [Parabacteroides sp. PF5-5]MDH63